MNTFQYISTNHLRWWESFLVFFILFYFYLFIFCRYRRACTSTRTRFLCCYVYIFFSFWDVKFAVWLLSGMCDKPLRGCRLTDRGSVHTLPVLTMISGGCWCDLCLMGRSSKLQPGTMRGQTNTPTLPKSMKSDKTQERKIRLEN